MCTYSQLKKNTKQFCATRVNGAPHVPKLYASSGKDISKCIEGESIKLATQVDYVICNVSHRYFRVINVFFFK